MKIARVIIFFLLATGILCGPAWAHTASLRVEPYTDVLIFSFTSESVPAYTLQRTGAQQLTLTFREPLSGPMEVPPRLDEASLIAEVRPLTNGFTILLKTAAFGFVRLPVPRAAAFELHIFSDAVGANWAEPSKTKINVAKPRSSETIRTAKARPPAKQAEAIPVQATEASPLSRPLISATPTVPTLAMHLNPGGAPMVEATLKPEPRSEPLPEEPVQATSGPFNSLPETQTHLDSPLATPTQEEGRIAEATKGFSGDAPPPPPELLIAPPAPGTPFSEGSGQLTLSEAVAEALKNNPRLLSFQSRAASAEYGVNSALGALLPRAQIGAGLTKITNPNNAKETDSDYINQSGKTYSIQISQNLFSGLMHLSNYARAKFLNARTNQELRKAELDTIEAVQRDFFKLIRTRSDIRSLRSSVTRLLNQRDAAHAFYRLEMAPRLTVLQVETALGQAEQKLSKALSDEQIQLVKLNSLLGNQERSHDFRGNLQGFSYENSLGLEDCMSKARANLPEVIIAKTNVEIAQEELNVSEGKALPRIDASASYVNQNTDYGSSTVADNNSKYYAFGLNLTWEFFSGGEHYYERESRKKLLRAAQEELANIQLSVHALVRESFLNVSEAKKQIRIALLRVKEASETYDQASTRFRSGIGTSIDMLDAHERITSAEAALNQAQADYLTSLASLHRSVGEKKLYLSMLDANGAGLEPEQGSGRFDK